MKKLLILPLMLVPFQTLSAADNSMYLELTYFAHATHKFSSNYAKNPNNKLDMVSIAYRNENVGFELSTFKNSYYKRSVALSYAEYWHPAKYIETSIHAGGVTGYPNTPVFVAASVAYTQSDLFIPKVTWYGRALVFSLSFKYRF